MQFLRSEERFLTALAGEVDPEKKRKIIGRASPISWSKKSEKGDILKPLEVSKLLI